MAWHRDTLLLFVCASIESSTITIVLMVGRHMSSFLPVALPSILGAFGLGLTFYCVSGIFFVIYSHIVYVAQ